MKTTVEIPDSLLERARKTARREKTTVRALIQEGLHRVLRDRGTPPFRLRDARFQGNGLQAGITGGDWNTIRDLIYQGHGS